MRAMMHFRPLPIALLLLTLGAAFTAPVVDAKQPRSQKAKNEFKVRHPCPATGNSRGSCPGYVIDHIVPLCAGGKDAPGNMQWQTLSESKLKDKEERKQCRRPR